jgi:hypothetical protein
MRPHNRDGSAAVIVFLCMPQVSLIDRQEY